MRERGEWLLRFASVLGLTRLRETLLVPAIADMRYEYGEARTPSQRHWVLARGYWSIAAGSALYTADSPARHVRENWATRDAPGPRLVRQSWRPVTAVATLCFAVAGTSLMIEHRQIGVGVMALLLPSMAVGIVPVALAMGVGWTLTRDRSGSRAALALGLLGAGLAFGVFEFAVPSANQAYRMAAYKAHTGKSIELRKGSREMTLRELGAATELAAVEACPMSAPASSCSGRATPALLRVEWHNRFSIPTFALSLMMLAVTLSRSGRRVIVVRGVLLICGGANQVQRWVMPYGVQGDIPAVVASWSAQLVLLTTVALLHLIMLRHRPIAKIAAI